MANQQEFDALQRALRDPVADGYREKADRTRRRPGYLRWTETVKRAAPTDRRETRAMLTA
jgi:hypothetical protein